MPSARGPKVVDTIQNPCYIKNIIKERGQNVRTNRIIGNHICGYQILSRPIEIFDVCDHHMYRTLFPTRGSIVDLWCFNCIQFKYAIIRNLGVDKDSILCYSISIIREQKEGKMLQELITEIKSRNAKTKAWVAEDPKNRWAGLYPEDAAHWLERGITSLADLERDELITYIYEGHKDAFGTKGRHYDFDAMSLEELRIEADYISTAANEAFEAEEAHKKECLKKFEALVQETIANGAGDEETALRWLSQNDTFYHIQDIESWVWDHGILFTDYGRKLVKKLEGLVTFKDWEAA